MRKTKAYSHEIGMTGLIRFMSKNLGIESHSNYFNCLTETLCSITGAEQAFIASTTSTEGFAETVSSYELGQHRPDTNWELLDTPCERVINEGTFVATKNVEKQFPADHHLRSLGAQAYVGIRILDKDGSHLGLLALVFQAPIDNPDFLLDLLKLFAVPVASELSRIRDQHLKEKLDRQLRSILSIAQEAIIATDEHYRIILFNEGAEAVFGYNRTEVLGKSVNMLLPAEMRSQHQKLMQNFSDSKDMSKLMSQRSGDIVAVRSNGTIFPAEASISKTPTENGNTITVVLRDVTDRKQSERALQSATRMQTLGNMAAGLAHDFNNILTLIRGSLDLALRESETPDRQQHHITVANRAIDRGAELVSRLLAFGRPRSLSPEAVSPSRLIDQLVEMLRVTLGEHIEVRLEKNASDCEVFVDPSQLENAIVNLSFNARDAMPSGGKLTISIDRIKLLSDDSAKPMKVSQGEYACIRVSDTGSGMTQETQKNAMEPFYSTKIDSGGSGLGLSMVLGFVKSANGTVRIKSRIDHGTDIELLLPVHRSKSEKEDQTFTHAGGDEKILVVEDQHDVRELAVTYASTLGYTVIEAEDGPQALKLLEENPDIDLLFTDFQLPNGYSGLDLAKLFSSAIPSVRILISSGYDTQSIGLMKYPLLPKPYSLQTFAKYLRNLLDD